MHHSACSYNLLLPAWSLAQTQPQKVHILRRGCRSFPPLSSHLSNLSTCFHSSVSTTGFSNGPVQMDVKPASVRSQ